jgi:hypothetical protein
MVIFQLSKAVFAYIINNIQFQNYTYMLSGISLMSAEIYDGIFLDQSLFDSGSQSFTFRSYFAFFLGLL